MRDFARKLFPQVRRIRAERHQLMNPVIIPRAFVVNHFLGAQGALDYFFHHEPMLQYIFLLGVIFPIRLGRSAQILRDARRMIWAIYLHIAFTGHRAATLPIRVAWARSRAGTLAVNPVFLANLLDQLRGHAGIERLGEQIGNLLLGLAIFPNQPANFPHRVMDRIME